MRTTLTFILLISLAIFVSIGAVSMAFAMLLYLYLAVRFSTHQSRTATVMRRPCCDFGLRDA